MWVRSAALLLKKYMPALFPKATAQAEYFSSLPQRIKQGNVPCSHGKRGRSPFFFDKNALHATGRPPPGKGPPYRRQPHRRRPKRRVPQAGRQMQPEHRLRPKCLRRYGVGTPGPPLCRPKKPRTTEEGGLLCAQSANHCRPTAKKAPGGRAFLPGCESLPFGWMSRKAAENVLCLRPGEPRGSRARRPTAAAAMDGRKKHAVPCGHRPGGQTSRRAV